jgi:hypothetical protein
MVSKYVFAATLEATRRTTNPEFAVVVSRVIPALDTEPWVKVNVLFPVPPTTVIVSEVATPRVVDKVPLATVRAPLNVGAAFTMTVKTETVVAPRLSRAVTVSK